jgi:hypothetical protein
MADYAVEGGPFLLARAELLTLSFNISWYDRFPWSSMCASAERHCTFVTRH